MEIENIKALVEGKKLNAYQIALAKLEFDKLIASQGTPNQALSMSGVRESDINLMFPLKKESEATDQQPLHRIMAYNSRQFDRREGAKILLEWINHSL